MSREAVSLLKGAGFIIKRKLGRQKFISVFRSINSTAKSRRKRDKLITKFTAECFADRQITKRLKRHDDMTDLALRVQRILNHPEYRDVKRKDVLRYTVAQLLIDPDHRERVENVLKENKKRNWPEYRPVCTAKKIKDPRTVINTIFTNLDKAWNFQRGRYYKTKAGIKFQKAVRDMLSRDFVTNYCLLAGYVPVMKDRKLGKVGKTVGETCGCRTFDKFALRKSYLKKIRREVNNYRYHTMKRSLQRIEQKSIIKLHSQQPDEKKVSDFKNTRPGVWTRVFKGTSSQVTKGNLGSESTSAVALPTVSCTSQLSEKAFAARDVLDISSPTLVTKDTKNVAIKAFAVTPDLPLKLMPARVLTYMELTTVLEHPNIVPFLESFATNSEIFVVMPYAENKSLNDIINTHGRLMQQTAQVWTFQIAMAMQYLHSAGIIHRNIKCSNILITEKYDALLSGFGSAKVKWLDLLHFQQTESTNYHAGYRPYRAPEVLRRRPYFLPPIDVWSLGVVLFRMLNNCFPYCYHNKDLMRRQQLGNKWRKTWRRDSPVSPDCLNLLKKMLEPKPEKRIKISRVVNHCWFTGLPIPKAHRNAVRKGAFLFLPKQQEEEDTQTIVTKQVSHKDVATTLEEIHAVLEKMTEKSNNRHFQPLETHAAYNDCYSKFKLRRGTLLRGIDQALRKPIAKTKRPPPPLEYEPYISDQEKTEIQEQTEAGIHELKKRPEQARKFLDAPEADDRAQISLREVVNNIKTKAEKLKARENEMAKKFSLFTPRRDASEPRSILASRSRSTRSGTNQLRYESSTSTMITWPSNSPLPQTSTLTTSSLDLPKQELVEAEAGIDSDLGSDQGKEFLQYEIGEDEEEGNGRTEDDLEAFEENEDFTEGENEDFEG